ncbi:MAG: hypothetical protein ACJAUD_001740 [Crocinitomicaceae bacterium]|jgi:hypothetical protein
MTIDSFFRTKGEGHWELLHQVNQMILSSYPGVVLKKKYGLPMYVLTKNVVYLDIQKGKPLVGVVYGIHLKEIHSLLDFTGRTQIGHFSLENMTEASYDDLYVVLATAVEFGLGQKAR